MIETLLALAILLPCGVWFARECRREHEQRAIEYLLARLKLPTSEQLAAMNRAAVEMARELNIAFGQANRAIQHAAHSFALLAPTMREAIERTNELDPKTRR
jgi:hypothetical protein